MFRIKMSGQVSSGDIFSMKETLLNPDKEMFVSSECD